jgi:hypothetical protein
MIGLLQFGTGSGSGMCPPSVLSGSFWERRSSRTPGCSAAVRSARGRSAALGATAALAPRCAALPVRRRSLPGRFRGRPAERGCAIAVRRVYALESPARSIGVPAVEVDALAAAAPAPEAAFEPPPAAPSAGAALPAGGTAPACPGAPPLDAVTGTVLVPPGGRPGALPVGGAAELGEDPPTDTLTSGAPEEDPPTDTPTSGAPEEEEEEEEEAEEAEEVDDDYEVGGFGLQNLSDDELQTAGLTPSKKAALGRGGQVALTTRGPFDLNGMTDYSTLGQPQSLFRSTSSSQSQGGQVTRSVSSKSTSPTAAETAERSKSKYQEPKYRDSLERTRWKRVYAAAVFDYIEAGPSLWNEDLAKAVDKRWRQVFAIEDEDDGEELPEWAIHVVHTPHPRRTSGAEIVRSSRRYGIGTRRSRKL